VEERKDIESLLKEEEIFYPPDEFLKTTYVKDRKALEEKAKNLETFWGDIAEELIWFKKWDKVLEWSPPFARWFIGGKCNIAYNALDRHIKAGKGNKIAIIWEGEEGRLRSITYLELYEEVQRFSAVLKGLGGKKGTDVTIYLPRIPEQFVTMLACARLGAPHSVVYGGFSVDALRERIVDSNSSILITVNGGYRNGKVVEFKKIADDALKNAPSIKYQVVIKRLGNEVNMLKGRDYWYHELMDNVKDRCPDAEIMDAEEPLFILYTSGTTGKPKGVVHVHGGYMVGVYISMKWVFDLRKEDIFWCTADPGWITGHSYIVYGPLLNGVTVYVYEGAPTFPDAGRWWSIIEKQKITILYTTPTAIRALARYGDEWPNKYDLSSLRLLGTVGEPINPAAWRWFHKVIGKGKLPIMDTWWQTETGMVIVTPFPTTPLKPGSATFPFPGIEVDILDENGTSVPVNKEGNLVIKTPWPAMLKTLYNDPERYKKTYWEKFPNYYLTGDSAKKDADGFIWIIGRVDEVIKVSGYRFGTAEIESALVSHPAVSEAAVIGKPDELKGNIIKAFVILKSGYNGSDSLREELRQHVGEHMGPIAKPSEIDFVDSLPKTRSGKIMRRVLKAKELGLPVGDLSTLEE
jgi:acetyl-CoA synthetase